MSGFARTLLALLFAVLFVAPAMLTASAEPIAERSMLATWARTDRPVAAQQVSRTWMWGPEPFTAPLSEQYDEGPDGARTVQYYDKSRMEITDPDGDSSSIWYVTNGLLVMELITGKVQLGDNRNEAHEPAEINVAGDANAGDGPAYASLQQVLHEPAESSGGPISLRINREGQITEDDSLAVHGVEASHLVEETGLRIADPFWDFMRSSGIVYESDAYIEAQLFQNPFFATGFPVTAAYWANVAIGGESRDVLLQCFERRCLTYTPDNDPGWQVESGNVGRHYYDWRYGQLDYDTQEIAFPSTGDVQITFIMEDPPNVADGDGEYVDIQNVDDRPVDLTGWRLEDEVGNSFTFPDGVVIEIDAALRIHVCDGQDTNTDLYWGRCSAVWNNDGDTAYLYDAADNLVHSWSY